MTRTAMMTREANLDKSLLPCCSMEIGRVVWQYSTYAAVPVDVQNASIEAPLIRDRLEERLDFAQTSNTRLTAEDRSRQAKGGGNEIDGGGLKPSRQPMIPSPQPMLRCRSSWTKLQETGREAVYTCLKAGRMSRKALGRGKGPAGDRILVTETTISQKPTKFSVSELHQRVGKVE
jgi:hypothetical protein